MEYTKGETAGGWIYIHKDGGMPIALVHPKYVDKFLAAPAMYEALKMWSEHQQGTRGHWCSVCTNVLEQALSKAEGSIT